MTVRYWPPVLLTLITLSSGLGSLEAARAGNWSLALFLILFAGGADAFDGACARLLDACSEMGAFFDSLADLVAFGVAPAFFLANHYASAPAPLRYGVALAFVAAGAFRLARFHAHPTPGAFRGLPITGAGVMLAVLIGGPLRGHAWAGAVAALALAGLMVSTLHMPKPHITLPLLAASALMIAVPQLVRPGIGTLGVSVAAGFVLYMLWAVAVALRTGNSGAQRTLDERAVPELGRSRT